GHRGRAGLRGGGDAGRAPLGPAPPPGRGGDRQPGPRRGPPRRRTRRLRRGAGAGAFPPAVVGLAWGWSYDLWLKGTVWSALPFAVAVPIVPLFGYGAAGGVPAALWGGWPTAAPLAVATHLADALPDVERDRATGVRGLTTRLGVGRAA